MTTTNNRSSKQADGKQWSVWETVIRIVIAVASALAGALGMQTMG